MPPGIKSIAYLDDILVYSKDPTGRSLSYMEDTMPYKLTETVGSKKLNPNSCSPDLWKNLEDILPHVPPEAVTICPHFRKNKCRHGLSGKFPVGDKKEYEAIHP